MYYPQPLVKNLCHAVHCTYSTKESKELSLSLYSDNLGGEKVNKPFISLLCVEANPAVAESCFPPFNYS